MTPEQQMELITILEETWMHIHSADEAYGLIEDIIIDVTASAKREVE